MHFFFVKGQIENEMENVLGHINTDMDGEFMTIRRKESNLGNFLCDIVLEVMLLQFKNLD
jgi:hypothetical protein